MIDWVKLDEKYIPDGEILAGNFEKGSYGYKEAIIGFLRYCPNEKFICENDFEILKNVTHWSIVNIPEDCHESR
jgi:hypothetical protein